MEHPNILWGKKNEIVHKPNTEHCWKVFLIFTTFLRRWTVSFVIFLHSYYGQCCVFSSHRLIFWVCQVSAQNCDDSSKEQLPWLQRSYKPSPNMRSVPTKFKEIEPFDLLKSRISPMSFQSWWDFQLFFGWSPPLLKNQCGVTKKRDLFQTSAASWWSKSHQLGAVRIPPRLGRTSSSLCLFTFFFGALLFRERERESSCLSSKKLRT